MDTTHKNTLFFLRKTVLIGSSRNKFLEFISNFDFMGIKCKLDKEDTNSDYPIILISKYVLGLWTPDKINCKPSQANLQENGSS